MRAEPCEILRNPECTATGLALVTNAERMLGVTEADVIANT